MRILHVIPQFPFFVGGAVIGGHASPLLTLARTQARGGDDVTILSYIQDQTADRHISARLKSVSLFPAAKTSTTAFGLRFLRSAVSWCKRNRNQFDILHMHSGFAEYLAVSSRLKSVLGLPAVHTLYCPVPLESGNVNRPIIRSIVKRAANSLDALSAISSHTADSLGRFGIAKEIAVVPPAVDLERFHPAAEQKSARKSFGFRDDEIVVLFVGNAKPQKNLSRVLSAFRLLRDRMDNVRLVITTELAAASSDERLARLRKQVLDLGIERDVTQFGIIENMPELIRACDVLVAPFMDSFGPSDYFMVVLEAMASAKPTIVSAVGGMPEVIDESRGRLIDPGDHQHIGRAMIELAEDGRLRERLGENARQYCEAKFSASDVAESFQSLYLTVL